MRENTSSSLKLYKGIILSYFNYLAGDTVNHFDHYAGKRVLTIKVKLTKIKKNELTWEIRFEEVDILTEGRDGKSYFLRKNRLITTWDSKYRSWFVRSTINKG